MADREANLRKMFPPDLRKQWVAKAGAAATKCYKSFPSHIRAAVCLDIDADSFISGETDFFTVGYCHVEDAYKVMKDKYKDYEDFYDNCWSEDGEFDEACFALASDAKAAIPKGSAYFCIDNLSGWDCRDYVVAFKYDVGT